MTLRDYDKLYNEYSTTCARMLASQQRIAELEAAAESLVDKRLSNKLRSLGNLLYETKAAKALQLHTTPDEVLVLIARLRAVMEKKNDG